MSLIKSFCGCGDNQIIEFAIVRARLNRRERQLEVIDSHMESIKTLYPKAYEETLEELKKYTKKDLQ